jgi:hypothetical protein
MELDQLACFQMQAQGAIRSVQIQMMSSYGFAKIGITIWSYRNHSFSKHAAVGTVEWAGAVAHLHFDGHCQNRPATVEISHVVGLLQQFCSLGFSSIVGSLFTLSGTHHGRWKS